jgi:hypothetical protein
MTAICIDTGTIGSAAAYAVSAPLDLLLFRPMAEGFPAAETRRR